MVQNVLLIITIISLLTIFWSDMNTMDAIDSETLDPYPACTTKVSHGCANIANFNSKLLETRSSVKNNERKCCNVMNAIDSEMLDTYSACTTNASHGCDNIQNFNSKLMETRSNDNSKHLQKCVSTKILRRPAKSKRFSNTKNIRMNKMKNKNQRKIRTQILSTMKKKSNKISQFPIIIIHAKSLHRTVDLANCIILNNAVKCKSTGKITYDTMPYFIGENIFEYNTNILRLSGIKNRKICILSKFNDWKKMDNESSNEYT